MILNTISFKNVKRNENIIKNKNKNAKSIKKRHNDFKNKKSQSDYNLINMNSYTNNSININPKKYTYAYNIYKRRINYTYSNINIFTDNINNIISNLKAQNQNKKTELSTDFSSKILIKNNNNRNNINYIQAKRGKSSTLTENLEKINYSALLKKQEKILLKKGKKRVAKSSVQMPHIIKKNDVYKKYKFHGLYNSKIDKDNNLKKEINELMIINQRLKFKKNKNLSFENNKLNNSININAINNNINKGKTLNVNIKFIFQRKKDEFLGKNRLLMKQNYFNALLKEKISKVENTNKNNEKKIKSLDDKIRIYKDCISFFKINNIINQDLKILDSVKEKNEFSNSKLIFTVKKLKKEIDKLEIKIKTHNNQRKEIIFWYEFLCKIKNDMPIWIKSDNYKEIVNCLEIKDLNKGFNQMAEKIRFSENKYKNVSDELFELNNKKEELNKNYELMCNIDDKEIKNKGKELKRLKEEYKDLFNVKSNIIKNYYYIKKKNKKYVFLQKIGKLFENYFYYLKNNKYFNLEEKEKVKKIQKEIIGVKNKNKNKNKKYYNYNLKNDKIKQYIYDIFLLFEKFANNILSNINKIMEKIGKEEYKKILNDFKLRERAEKKMLFVYDKEDEKEEENLIEKNKIYFLPIKKVYIPFFAIKKENSQNNGNILYNKSFSCDKINKNLSKEDENLKKRKTKIKSLYYMDDEGIDKYNELFFV